MTIFLSYLVDMRSYCRDISSILQAAGNRRFGPLVTFAKRISVRYPEADTILNNVSRWRLSDLGRERHPQNDMSLSVQIGFWITITLVPYIKQEVSAISWLGPSTLQYIQSIYMDQSLRRQWHIGQDFRDVLAQYLKPIPTLHGMPDGGWMSPYACDHFLHQIDAIQVPSSWNRLDLDRLADLRIACDLSIKRDQALWRIISD
jgi:hypothetical protein